MSIKLNSRLISPQKTVISNERLLGAQNQKVEILHVETQSMLLFLALLILLHGKALNAYLLHKQGLSRLHLACDMKLFTSVLFFSDVHL